MIRIASFLVFFIGAAVAFGAFYLARGSENSAPVRTVQAEEASEPAPAPEPEVVETPEADKLYYLRDIDFTQGEITVVYHLQDAPLIVRDQGALSAAKDQVYVNSNGVTAPQSGALTLSSTPAAAGETVLQIFRNDTQIAALKCPDTDCATFDSDADSDHADLLETAFPYQLVNDTFATHESYLNAILLISENNNFMLLDNRPSADFPAEPIIPTLTISLPTAVVKTDGSFDPKAFETQIREAVNQHLSEGAQIDGINTAGLRPAYIADKDNGQFVLANAQPIAFPHAQFLPVTVEITGIDTLSDAAYDAITEATLIEYSVGSDFEDFVTTRLQTNCVDCYFLKVDGPFYRSTRPTAQTTESYQLDYYDLREAP